MIKEAPYSESVKMHGVDTIYEIIYIRYTRDGNTYYNKVTWYTDGTHATKTLSDDQFAIDKKREAIRQFNGGASDDEYSVIKETEDMLRKNMASEKSEIEKRLQLSISDIHNFDTFIKREVEKIRQKKKRKKRK